MTLKINPSENKTVHYVSDQLPRGQEQAAVGNIKAGLTLSVTERAYTI